MPSPSNNQTLKIMTDSINTKQIATIAGLLLTGLFLGWLIFGGTPGEEAASIEEHISETHTNAKGEIVYTCSMHPSVRQNEPGNCPICGMELIPVGNAGRAGDENPYQLTMTPAAVKLAQIQTTEVVREAAYDVIRMPGKVAVDERKVANISAQFPGRIEELHVDFTGQQVSRGEKLASIYSPKLITAQKELLESARHKESNPVLYEAARRKLALWELPASTIEEIERSGEIKTTVDIVSPVNGIVTQRNISREQYVDTGSLMYHIADLSRVWLIFNAYESDLAGLDKGDQVTFTVDAYPGETFKAHISYIDPILDSQSRTARVRAEAANPGRRLKPQMLAEGIISSRVGQGSKQLLIPKSAVLWTGERSVVYVKKPGTEKPTFEFREVVLGRRVGNQYVVKSGVREGEAVVTHGNFKLDSAAQLAGKASMMNRNPDGTVPGGHNHGSTDGAQKQNTPLSQAVADTGNHRHAEHLSRLVNHYLRMKNALADDHYDRARRHLELIRTEVTGNENMNNHPEHAAKHEQHHRAMTDAITAGMEATNIKQLRKSFTAISENLVKAVRKLGYEESPLYLQYCPMAHGKEGSYWISEHKEIHNPYLGQAMLNCGETREVLHRSRHPESSTKVL